MKEFPAVPTRLDGFIIYHYLMKRFYITLCVLPNNEEVDPNKLHQYNLENARLYTRLYNWYHMPQAVHKMLAHSHQVVSIKAIPVRSLSEEPQESSIKLFKYNREHHTMMSMLCSSDPKVSRMRRSQRKDKDSSLPEEAKELLMD